MTKIHITAGSELVPWHDDYLERPRQTFEQWLKVTIHFTVYVNHVRCRAMVVHMNARYTSDDDALRAQLKRDYWGEKSFSVGCVGEPDPANAEVYIDDPKGILEWLRLTPDDPIFNTQKRLNDQPVRLPPAGIDELPRQHPGHGPHQRRGPGMD